MTRLFGSSERNRMASPRMSPVDSLLSMVTSCTAELMSELAVIGLRIPAEMALAMRMRMKVC